MMTVRTSSPAAPPVRVVRYVPLPLPPELTAPTKATGIELAREKLPILHAHKEREQETELERATVVRDPSTGAVADRSVDDAFDNATAVVRHFSERFGRNGWDDKGTPLDVVVGTTDLLGGAQGSWDNSRSRMRLGGEPGTGTYYPGSREVIAHELVHGFFDAKGHRYASSTAASAIEESWADVLGTSLDHDDWSMGEDSSADGTPVRRLDQPAFDDARLFALKQDDPIVDAHDLAGVPTTAAVRASAAIGRSTVEDVWYAALGLMSLPLSLEGAAAATVTAASNLYGADHVHTAAIRDAWRSVHLGEQPTLGQKLRDRFGR